MDFTPNIYPNLAQAGLDISSETSTIRIGTLTFESPIRLWENSSFYGPCSFGAYSYMNRFAMFYNLHVGRFCSIAGYVRGVGDHDAQFSTHPIWSETNRGMFPLDHSYIKITEDRANGYLKDSNRIQHESKITIGHDVWIGENVLIKAGVCIGNGAIIGANSFVKKNVPAYSVVAGTPAVVKKMRYSEKIIIKLEQLSWWHYQPADFAHLIDKSNIEKTIDLINEGIFNKKISILKPAQFVLSQVIDGFEIKQII